MKENIYCFKKVIVFDFYDVDIKIIFIYVLQLMLNLILLQLENIKLCLLADQLQVLILISPKDDTCNGQAQKNGRWIIPF